MYKTWLPWWLSGKESTCNAGDAGDWGSIPGSKRSPGGRNGNPLQYSCPENPMDRGAWRVTVHGVAKSWTWLKRLSKQSFFLLKWLIRNAYREMVPNYNLASWLSHKNPLNTPLLLGLPTLTRAQKLLLSDQSASECGSQTNKLARMVTMCSYLTMSFLFISWMPFLFKLFSVCWWGNMKIICYSVICKVGELEIPLFSQVSTIYC